jgi:hypothetical protein
MNFHQLRSLFMAVALVFTAGDFCAAQTNPPAQLTAAQIIDEMQRHNQLRTDALKLWKSTRIYETEYKGYSKTIAARMVIEFSFDVSSGKSFRIVSQSGSKLLCEKVLKRAAESEKEASQEKASSALTLANYSFKLVGSENLNGRPAYILQVEPITASKFLIRGKIWIDAAEFALVKVDAEPAKNPSFWIAHTRVLQSYSKTGSFWLPERNRSETRVRVGGVAAFTIDYGSYQIESKATPYH